MSKKRTHFENRFGIEKIEFRSKRIHPFDLIRCAVLFFCRVSSMLRSTLTDQLFVQILIVFPNVCTRMMAKGKEAESKRKKERNQRIEAEKIQNRIIIFHSTHSFASLQLPSLQFYADYFHIPAARALKCRDVFFSLSLSLFFTHTHTRTQEHFSRKQHNQ